MPPTGTSEPQGGSPNMDSTSSGPVPVTSTENPVLEQPTGPVPSSGTAPQAEGATMPGPESGSGLGSQAATGEDKIEEIVCEPAREARVQQL